MTTTTIAHRALLAAGLCLALVAGPAAATHEVRALAADGTTASQLPAALAFRGSGVQSECGFALFEVGQDTWGVPACVVVTPACGGGTATVRVEGEGLLLAGPLTGASGCHSVCSPVILEAVVSLSGTATSSVTGRTYDLGLLGYIEGSYGNFC